MTEGNAMFAFSLTGTSSGGGTPDIAGCTDDSACNYDDSANSDDGSCEYPSGCDNACGSDLVDDECGVCGGDSSSCDDGCGPNEPGPSGCDNTCGSDLVDDACGVCGGDGSDDVGCGCFEAGPSGCDDTCGSTLATDSCGVCGGDGTSCVINVDFSLGDAANGGVDVFMFNTHPVTGFQFSVSGMNLSAASGGSAGDAGFDVATGPNGVLGVSFSGSSIPAGDGLLTSLTGSFDDSSACLGDLVLSVDGEGFHTYTTGNCVDTDAIADCAGDWGGFLVLDVCGVCDGDGSSCFGNIDQSQSQAFYYLSSASLNGVELSSDDYILAYYNDMLVGSVQWTGANTILPIMGEDDTPWTDGFIAEGSIPQLSIFDSSEGISISVLGANYELANSIPAFQFNEIFLGVELSVIDDCNSDIGGSAYLDNCSDCSEGLSGHADDQNDPDGDDVCNSGAANGDADNCPDTSNADQWNYDGDADGDACDSDDDNDGALDDADS
jgi:hypothetical protein